MKQADIDALKARFAGTDLAMPEEITQLAKIAWAVIVTHIEKRGATYTGGCKAFRRPEEFALWGEPYCKTALLVIVYDGSDVANVVPFGSKGEPALTRALHECGLFTEDATRWYSGVYPC